MGILSRKSSQQVVMIAIMATVVACSRGDSAPSGGVPDAPSNPYVGYGPNGRVTLLSAEPEEARSARSRKAVAQAPRVVPGEFLVKFKRNVSRSSAMSALNQVPLQSARQYHSTLGLHHVRVAPGWRAEQVIAAYRKHLAVEYVEPNYIVRIATTPNDPRFPEQWGLNNIGQGTGFTVDADIDAPEAWDITVGSNDVVIAVIDTGVDYTHQDLAPNVFVNSVDCNNNGIDDDGNGFVDDCHGIDSVNGD